MAEREPKSSSIIGQYAAGAANPAGPRGLQTTSQQAHDVAAQAGAHSDSLIGQYVVDGGSQVEAARSWYTGANMEGVSNGWDTGFAQEAFKQYSEQIEAAKAAEDGTEFYNWFDRADATGVSLWDDEDKGIERGDVFNAGKKVGNVYKDFDSRTANVMMAEFTLDRETKAKIFADPDRDRWLADEVTKVLDDETVRAQTIKDQVAFEGDVDARQAAILEGKSEKAIAGAGFVGAATFGAGVGSFAGPVGTAVGALAFGTAGAVGAWKNRDQLSEQIARAEEITSRARATYGDLEANTIALKEWSGVGMRMISPASNLVQGIADDVEGDGDSRFYRIDEDGNREVGGWTRAADVGATVVDAIGQFSNPLAAATYLTTMGGNVAGSTAFMAQTGAGWNDRIGDFDDYEGSKEWAAAIGNVGIDVVQMGMAGAVVRAGAASRAAFGASEPSRIAQRVNALKDKLRPWGDDVVDVTPTIQGRKFGLNARGEAVESRFVPSVALLAPSESIRYVNMAWRARSRAALGEKPGADDFYRAALETAGGNRFSQAIVTGWAEGAEEGVQAVLEPVSFSADVEAGQIVESVLYGAASGMGMGLASMAKHAANDQVLSSRAKALEQLRNGVEYTAEEWKERWKGVDADQKKRLANADPGEAAKMLDTLRSMQELHKFDSTYSSPIAATALDDINQSMFARDLANANPNRDNVLVLAGMSADRIVATDADGNVHVEADALPAHAGATSIFQALLNISNHQLAMGVVMEDTERQHQALTAELASADGDRALEIQEQLTRLADEMDLQARTAAIGNQIRKRLAQVFEQYRSIDPMDVAAKEAAIDLFNEIIANAFSGREMFDETGAPLAGRDLEAARRAVELMVTRHPNIAGDSFALVMPFASKAMSRANANGTMQVHQSTLLAPGADHDGDTEVTVNFGRADQVTLDYNRAGMQYLAPVTREDGTEGFSVTVDPPDGEKTFVAQISRALNAAAVRPEWGVATGAVHRLVTDVWDRLSPHMDNAGLTKALDDFQSALRDGDPGARLALVTDLVNADPEGWRAAALANGAVPQVPWLMQRVTLAWEQILTGVAAQSHHLEFTPRDVDADLTQDKAYQRALSKREAATDGQTAYLVTEGNNATREGQKLHYDVYRAAVSMERGDMSTELFERFVRLYAELGSNMGQSEIDRVRGRNAVERRVTRWLQAIHDDAKKDPNTLAPASLLMLANTRVADVRPAEGGGWDMFDGQITLAQLLLRKSVEIERQLFRTTLQADEEMERKLRRFERLASPDPRAGESTTPYLALKEIFGSFQVHDLLGDSAKYLGPHLTINQLVAGLANRSPEARSQQLYRWKRKAPYVLHEHVSDAPYSVEDLLSGNLSAYKVVVDTISASVNTDPRRLREQNVTDRERFKKGITSLREILDGHRKLHGETLADTSDIGVLRAVLTANPAVAKLVADLVPDAAKLGAFALIDGRPVAAKWVEEMLVSTPDKAALLYVVNTRLSEWNQMGGEIDLDPEVEGTGREKGTPPKAPARAAFKMKSRLLQLIQQLAAQPDGIQLDRLVSAMKNAASVEALEEIINNDPAFSGDRAELLLFVDDVAAYEPDISQVWSANLPGTLQREAIAAFAERTTVLSTAMANFAAEHATERTLLKAVLAYDTDRTTDRDGAAKHWNQLEVALKARRLGSDHLGPAVRDRFTEKVQDGIIRIHDKGTADAAIAPFGEALVTTDEFGVKQSVFQAVDSLTVMDAEDILSNPTKLAEGPVVVAGRDGSEVIVDFTTVRGAAIALMDPATNALAKQVLFPTARDVNAVGSLSTYLNVTHPSLTTMLKEANYSDLFVHKDDRLTVAQAHKYIGMVEAAVRRKAIDGSPEEQARAYFPIQTLINEFVIAYTHSPGAETKNEKKVRDQVYVDIATALQQISALNSKDPRLVEQMSERVRAILRDRFHRTSSELSSALKTKTDQAIEDSAILDVEQEVYTREVERLTTQLDATTDPAEQATLLEALDRANKRIQERLARLNIVLEDDVVTSAINMFTMSGDPVADTDRKGAILRLLGSGNRVSKFQGNYHLLNRLNTVLANDQYALSDPAAFTTEEWSELGLWASTIYLSEITNRSGSSIKLTPLVLGEKGEKLRRYYDPTWASLLDGFLNPQVLDAAGRMAEIAQWRPDFTDVDVASTLEGGLFNEKNLGRWTELVVPAALKAQQVLDSASVGLAIPVGGDLPKEIAAYVGAGRRTFTPVDDTMLTTRAFAVDADGAMTWDADAFFKLNNHFAKTVVLRDSAGTEVDLMGQVGQAWVGEPSVEASGYKVITRTRLDKAIADAVAAGTLAGNVEVEISYFDIDTRPWNRAHANSVYFEGIGRDVLGATPGLVAEMVSAPGAISKEAQQNPLNMATKGGAGYKATKVIELARKVALEQSTSVAGVLRAKAHELWVKTYDVGQPMAGDANSLYKLMLQRHVVVGTNVAGEKEVWWAGQAIEWQSLNAGQPLSSPDFPLTDARLVSLSDSQAQTLLGEPGNKGLPGVVSRPRLNLADLDVFPELTPQRLADAGLTRLGETGTLRDTALSGRLPLMNVQWSGDRDTGANTRYEAAIEKFRGTQLEVFNRRRQEKFATATINDVNANKLHRMLGLEGLTSLFTRMGVPFAELRDPTESRLSDVLATKLQELTALNPSSVVWQHLHGQVADPARGLLSDTTIRETDGFSGKPQATWPTYEDVVIIDLDSFVTKTGKRYVEAYDQALDAIRTYTRTGVTIVLAGDQRLRSDLAEHLNSGAEGYARMAQSAHFFGPAQPDSMMHLSQEALDATLSDTRVFTGTSLILTHNSDRYSSYGSSENATFWDLRPEQPVWRAEGVTLLPTSVGTQYGLPVKGTGAGDQESLVFGQLEQMLTDPVWRDHLKRLGGDPENVPLYRVENGVEEPGIRSVDDAMDRLLDLVKAKRSPLTVDEELMIGDFIPTVAADGSLLLVRVGFELPEEHELREQLVTPIDPTDPVPTPGRIAVASNKLAEAWTTKPPGQIEEINPDQMAGASVLVRYDMSRLGKSTSSMDGWKTVRSNMPDDLAGPDEAMSANGLRVNSFSSQKSPESKQAITGSVDGFGWAFALAGIDFRPDLVEFFLGAGRPAADLESDWNQVRSFLDEWARTSHNLDATRISKMLSEESYLAVVGPQINTMAEQYFGESFALQGLDDQFAKPTPNQRLAQIILATLMVDRITVDDVVRTSGLLSLSRLDEGAQVQLLPDLLTANLKDAAHPELRDQLVDRINARMPRRPDGSRPYILGKDFTFYIEMQHPKTGVSEYVPGKLQISLEYPADENAVSYTQAGIRSSRQGVSQHVAFVSYETLGMRTATERASRVEQQVRDREGLADLDIDGGFFRMLRNVPTSKTDPTFSPWRTRTRLEKLEIQEAAGKLASYLKPLDLDGWTAAEVAAYRKLQDEITEVLFGRDGEGYRVEVDYLVRQWLGMPESRADQPEYVGKIGAAAAHQAVSIIRDNVRDNLIPSYAGVVPMPNHPLMAAIFEANLSRPEADRWAPAQGTGRRRELAAGWDDWVKTVFGQVEDSSELIDATFAQDINGFMHTWQSANDEQGPTHVSLDQLRQHKLYDLEANRFVTSIDPAEDARLTQPVVFETMRATLDMLVGGESAYTREAVRTTPDSELSKRLEKHVAWRSGKRLPKQRKQSYKEFRDQGAWYLASTRDGNNFFHNIINLSAGMRLLNPALWTSAIFETFFNQKIQTGTNLLTGRSTSMLGRGVAAVGERAGLQPRYTPEQIKKVNDLAEHMGRDDHFLAELYDEMVYRNFIEAGRGSLGGFLEKFAATGARMSAGPFFGMREKEVAKRYIEAAIEYLDTTDNVVPFDVLIGELNKDPLWLAKQFRSQDRGDTRFNPHRAGMNRIAEVRAIKASVPSKLIMGGVDLLMASEKPFYHAAGAMLKIPLLFTRFNSGALIRMAGLSGLDQMTAMMVDQRTSTAKGWVKGVVTGEPRSAQSETIDMTDIITGANLFRPFVQGAMTHTGMLAFGMMAGSLGLSGEDEETKRRRRLASYMDLPFYYDPRAVQNDFRYADAIFVDWMPGWMESILEPGDVAGPAGEKKVLQPHWIFRQFLSPVMGVERFLTTGDVRQIGWGFSDAFAVMPNSIARIWNEAKMTADLLAQSAREVDGVAQTGAANDAESQALAQKFIITVAGVYEKALMENSFINAIRNGADDYDRNPWEIPAELKNGGYKLDPATGQPVPTEALEQDIDPRTGEAIVSYKERDAVDAYLHQYAENNLSAALMLSLFTGQPTLDSTYFRQNMVPAQKTLTLPERGQAYDETVIMAALQGMRAKGEGYDSINQYEAEQMVWASKPDGAFWSGEDVAARAREMVAQWNGAQTGGLTLLDAEGKEILTKEGARGVLNSLARGAIDLGHPSLAGIHITVPMRQQIQEEWTQELVAEGMGMGLTERVAQIRARRIWFGDRFNDPNATGLRDLLWTEEIPWTGKVTYNQLNTTFVMGPDGRPWATPFERQNLLQALGIPLPSTPIRPTGGGLSRDSRGNVVDDVYGINTGLMALERVEDQGRLAPPEDDPKAFSEPMTKSDEGGSSGGSGWRNFGYTPYKRRGYTPYKRRSYSSGGGSTGYPNFTRMYGLPNGQTPYGNDIPFINTSNPILRRADVRRERVWSERGRLNQWQ